MQQLYNALQAVAMQNQHNPTPAHQSDSHVHVLYRPSPGHGQPRKHGGPVASMWQASADFTIGADRDASQSTATRQQTPLKSLQQQQQRNDAAPACKSSDGL